MLVQIRTMIVVMLLALLPVSASALSWGNSLHFYSEIGDGDTFFLSDYHAHVTGGNYWLRHGSFELTITNDFASEGTFSLGHIYSYALGHIPHTWAHYIFEIPSRHFVSYGPFSAILQPGESLLLKVFHGAGYGWYGWGGLHFHMSGSAAIPLPASVWLMLSALGLGGLMRWSGTRRTAGRRKAVA